MNKAALITGGAKRIGQALCQELANDHVVVVHYNQSKEAAEALANELGGVTVRADLAEPDALAGLVELASKQAGVPVSCLINNASQFQPSTFQSASHDDFARMMNLHAWAPWQLSRQLADQGGDCVVNLVDTRIVSADAQHAAYQLSKQALASLTVSTARAFAPMRVNAIAPGPVLPANDGLPDSFDAAVAATLLGRAATLEDIAQAVRFMVDARNVTGQVLHVSGGRDIA